MKISQKHRAVVVLDVELDPEIELGINNGKTIRDIQDYIADRINLDNQLIQKNGIIKYVSTEDNGEIIAADENGVAYLERVFTKGGWIYGFITTS